MIEDRCLACKCTYGTGCLAEQRSEARRAEKPEPRANLSYGRIIVRRRPGIRQEALAATAARRAARQAKQI